MAEPSVIDLVEQAYDLERDEEGWLAALTRTATQVMRAPLGGFAYSFRIGDDLRLMHRGASFSTEIAAEPMLHEMYARATPPVLRYMYRDGPPCGTLDDVVASTGAPPMMAAIGRAMFHELASFGDLYVVTARGHAGRRVHLNFPYRRELTRSSANVNTRWTLVSRHLSAALRLRDAGELATAEAVYRPDGTRVHAQGDARAPAPAAALRRAVLARERARLRAGRADPERALSVWQGLVDGRWSLVDRFDADGRRFLVARRNEPDASDPRRLTDAEVRAAELLAAGLSTKVMAARLGVSNARVGALVASLAQKTGSTRRADLVGLLRGFMEIRAFGQAAE